MTYPPYPNDPNPYQQPVYPYGPGVPQGPRNNGMAIASMCVSLFSLSMCGMPPVPLIGAILGHVAMREINQNPDAYSNRNMALAGIIIGWIFTGLWACFVLFMILAASGVLGPELAGEFD